MSPDKLPKDFTPERLRGLLINFFQDEDCREWRVSTKGGRLGQPIKRASLMSLWSGLMRHWNDHKLLEHHAHGKCVADKDPHKAPTKEDLKKIYDGDFLRQDNPYAYTHRRGFAAMTETFKRGGKKFRSLTMDHFSPISDEPEHYLFRRKKLDIKNHGAAASLKRTLPDLPIYCNEEKPDYCFVTHMHAERAFRKESGFTCNALFMKIKFAVRS
eukprot:gene17116-20349_t